MTDYLGNEIKAGYEICLIKVIDRAPKIWMLIPLGNGKSETVIFEAPPDKPCWIVGKYYTMINGDNYWVKSENFECMESLSFNYEPNDASILAIKGISDNEEMYLNFKRK